MANTKQLREGTISALRGHIRATGGWPQELTGEQAYAVLDEWMNNPDDVAMVARIFYNTMTDAQYDLLVRDWNKWRKGYRQPDRVALQRMLVRR